MADYRSFEPTRLGYGIIFSMLVALLSILEAAELFGQNRQDGPVSAELDRATFAELSKAGNVIELPARNIKGVGDRVHFKLDRLAAFAPNAFVVALKIDSGERERLRTIKTSCGCTVGVPESVILKPRENFKMFFRVTPKKIGRFGATAKLVFESGEAIDLVFTGDALGKYSPAETILNVDERQPPFKLVFHPNSLGDKSSERSSSDQHAVRVFCPQAPELQTRVLANGDLKVSLAGFSEDAFKTRRRKIIRVEITDDARSEFHEITCVNPHAFDIRPNSVIAVKSDGEFTIKHYVRISKEEFLSGKLRATVNIDGKASKVLELSLIQSFDGLCLLQASLPKATQTPSKKYSVTWTLQGSDDTRSTFFFVP